MDQTRQEDQTSEGQSSQGFEIETDGPKPPSSYKEILQRLKQTNDACDTLMEKIAELNSKYSLDTARAAVLIQPAVAKILFQEDKDFPGVQALSQTEKIPKKELDKKYNQMCRALDQYQMVMDEDVASTAPPTPAPAADDTDAPSP